jgi:hypothetical protein
MKQLWVFQNWEFGKVNMKEPTSEAFSKKVEECGKDVYQHCDINFMSFCYMSHNKEKLLECAKQRRDNYIEEYKDSLNFLKNNLKYLE